MVYKQLQVQIAKNLSTLLSTLSASDLVEKGNFVNKIVAHHKKYGKKMSRLRKFANKFH